MKISYAPYSKNLHGPADRRRFLYYAKKFNLEFEFYSNTSKDCIVIANPFSNNLQRILIQARNNEVKLIFELIDSLFLEPFFSKYHIIKSIKEKRLNKYLIDQIIKYSSKIIVSNASQKEFLLSKVDKNIEIIPDYSYEYKKSKNTRNFANHRLRIGWEGMGLNSGALNQIEKFGIDKEHDLILITDLAGKSNLSKQISIHQFFNWEEKKHIKQINEVDIMLLPSLNKSWIHLSKPATRIRHYFNMGKPVIAFPNCSNFNEMSKANLAEFCAPIYLWSNLINSLRDRMIRKEYLKRIDIYKKKYLNEDLIDISWKNIVN